MVASKIIDNALTFLKIKRPPEVEISDLDDLKVYVGNKVEVVDPSGGKSGRHLCGIVTEVNDIEGKIIAGEIICILREEHFKRGIRVYPEVKNDL